MSRVNEAMRRATEGSAENTDETVALAQEPFPGETRDAGQVNGQPAVVALTGGPIDAQERRAEDAPPNTDERAARRLFEQFDARVSEKIVVDQRMPSIVREQYRRLAAVLHDAQAVNRTQVVMVASAMPGEGKTLTAANIALTLSSSYRRRVLIIDGDLRRPTLHQIFRVETARGLADGLASKDSKITLTQVTPNLALLPAGRPTTDPMAGLISERMQRLIAEARAIFDWVIIDTPPLVLLPDANLLASMTDAALLVVRAESTPHALVKRAMDAVGRSRVMGVVLNAATVSPHGEYGGYGHYYYYGSRRAPARS
jgi:capsular exopolysaccharide synthesis family protein